MIVFLADKIAWDQGGEPPYLKELLKLMENSLDEAALFYINDILAHDIKVKHTWLLEAKRALENNVFQGQIIKKNDNNFQ